VEHLEPVERLGLGVQLAAPAFKVPVVLGLQALAEHLELPGHPVLEARPVQPDLKGPVVLGLQALAEHLEQVERPVLEARLVQPDLKGPREPEQQVRRGQQVQLEFRVRRGLEPPGLRVFPGHLEPRDLPGVPHWVPTVSRVLRISRTTN
jgi:hypothetical protein